MQNNNVPVIQLPGNTAVAHRQLLKKGAMQPHFQFEWLRDPVAGMVHQDGNVKQNVACC
jgi:hypothetical protein